MAISLNLGAMSVFFFLITYLCVQFFINEAPHHCSSNQMCACSHAVLLFSLGDSFKGGMLAVLRAKPKLSGC